MKERSILFSASMVCAILEGHKTQTRRVVKPQPIYVCPMGPAGAPLLSSKPNFADGNIIRCPYGVPGDRLWVRETFYCDHAFYPEGTPPSCYWDGAKLRAQHAPEQLAYERARMLEAMYYRADGEPEFEGADGPTPWRPSIHMPRWASRILLEVTVVHVERLQEINRGDAMEEGCPFPNMAQGDDPRQWYRALWEQINGPSSWDGNPWVWVVEFKRVAA